MRTSALEGFGAKMANKSISQILSIDPTQTSLANQDPEVNAWNADVLAQVVQRAVRTFPSQPNAQELEEYRQLSERAALLSRQFEERSPEYKKIAAHVAELRELVGPFEIKHGVSSRELFDHPLVHFAERFDGTFDEGMGPRLRLEFIQLMRKLVVPAILDGGSTQERKRLQVLLTQLAHVGKALEEYDIDGSFEESFLDCVKQFLFKGVVNHYIYQNLLNHPERFEELSEEEKHNAAKGINTFILTKLAPFLRDLDVEPSYLEIAAITNHLHLLNRDDLTPSIKILESFL